MLWVACQAPCKCQAVLVELAEQVVPAMLVAQEALVVLELELEQEHQVECQAWEAWVAWVAWAEWVVWE